MRSVFPEGTAPKWRKMMLKKYLVQKSRFSVEKSRGLLKKQLKNGKIGLKIDESRPGLSWNGQPLEQLHFHFVDLLPQYACLLLKGLSIIQKEINGIMNEDEKYEVILYEDKWQFREDGSVLYSPIRNLEYSPPESAPITYGCLSFAGHDLDQSTLLIGTKVFYLGFQGEMPDELYREAWADPLRAKILKRLSKKNRSWYISFVGDITERIILDDGRKVPEKLFQYFSKMDPSRVTTVMSEKPFGFGNGFERKMFFEIPNQEIEWAVQNIWPEAMEIYPIEGYNLPQGRIDLIRNWDQKKRDDRLFREVLENSYLSFFTYPEEHRHFKFVTLNLELQEFTEMINLESLQKKADEIAEKKKVK